jgi:hypothetical protein
MLLVAPLLLAIIAAVNSQAITWTQQLPKDFVLINKDQLSLPIDEYVSLSSGIFTTTEPTKNVIVPKIETWKEARSKQGNNMQACSIAFNSMTDYSIFVCGINIIRMEKNDNFMIDNQETSKSVTLVTPASATPALKNTSTLCTDMISFGGRFIVNCYDTSSLSNPNYLFSVSETLDPASPNTIGTCATGDLKGDSKVIKLTTTNVQKLALLFLDLSRTSNPTPGNISLPYCNVDTSAPFTASTGSQNNLFSIINNASLSKGVLRYVASWSATEILAFIAVNDGTIKSLYFVPLAINDVGVISAHPTLNISQWNGTDIPTFNPNFLTFTKTKASDTFVASDKANIYVFSFNSSMQLKAPVWSVTLDCGLAANTATYISRVQINGGDEDVTNPASRTLVVYSNADSKKIREFAVHINNTKYGCSRATTAADSSKLDVVNTVSFTDQGGLMVTADNKLTLARINYNTMLQINVGEETGDKSVEISVKMDGWTSPAAQKFEYKTLKNAQDFNSIAVGSKTYKTYSGSSSYLSIPSFSFKGNNPTISSSNSNVQLRYSSTPAVSLAALNIADYNIHRIFAVDEDSFVAVLRKANTPEAFIRFWNKWDGSKNTLVLNSTLIALADRQILFKMFKLGPSIICAIYKSNGVAAKKLVFSCFDDKADSSSMAERSDAKNLVITDTYEISDIQILEGESRVELFMIGTSSTIKDNAILHYYVTIDSTGKVLVPASSNYFSKIDITTKELQDYYPIDIMYDVYGDSEGTNYVTIKQISKFNLRPVVAKYNVSISSASESPPMLTYIYHMYIPSQDMAYCAIRNEIIFFSPKSKKILVNKMIRVPTGVTLPQNRLYLPVSDYGITYLQQFNCIPEKGIFQVLGVDSNKNKFLVNFRGGDSTNGARRVHSVVKVAQAASFLETAFNGDYIVSVLSSPGKTDIARDFVYTYFDGPKFIVDNKNMKESFDVSITSSSQSSATSQATIKVELVNPMYKAEVKPRETFQLLEGKTIYLDQVSTINGPVMDIKLEGADASKVTLVKRNNKHKGYNAGETTTADRIFADEGFMALLWTGTKVKIMGDPSLTKTNGTNPVEILSESGNIKEGAMVKYGAQDNQAIFVTRVYSETSFKYNIYHLSRIDNKDKTFTHTFVKSEKLFDTPIDYDSMQITTIGNGDVVLALKMKRSFNSNYIRLVSFYKDTGNKFFKRASTILTVDSSKEIGGHSLVWDGKERAAVVAFYKDFDYFIYASWDGKTTDCKFRPSTTKVKLSDSETVSLAINSARCWTGSIAGTLECVVDAQGVVDYLLTITPEPNQKGELDPLMSIVKTSEFEMPPLFEIKRIDRGKDHYGFLLKRSAINVETAAPARRILQQTMALDAFSACQNIIVFYKPSVGRFIYTGITCSEWGNNTNIDFAMEYESNEYIYLTKWPVVAPTPTPARRVLQTSTTDRVGANYLATIQVTVNGAVDPNQVKFTFLGLNGPNDPTTNPAVTLNDFKQGTPPATTTTSSGSSFWTWFIIILVVLLVVGGGIYGYIWYQNSQTSAGTSTYTKQVDRDSSKSDLEDNRL